MKVESERGDSKTKKLFIIQLQIKIKLRDQRNFRPKVAIRKSIDTWGWMHSGNLR